MKILFDHQMFMIQNWGGISRYFCEIIKSMRTSGDVSVRLYGGLPEAGGLLHQERGSLEGDLQALFVPHVPRTTNVRKAMASAWFPVVARRFRPDVFHPTYFHPTLAGLPRSTGLVVTMYDMINERFDSQPDREAITSAKRRIVDRVDRIVCISRKTADDLVELFGVREDRIDVVHLATSISSCGSAGYVHDRPYLLYVGQKRGYKNFAALRAAYERTPRLREHFDLLCFGGEQLGTEEKASKGRVVQMGGDDRLLADLYRGARAFVYPSLYEGFGLPLLEAMTLGCPVVTTRCGSIPEVAEDGASYFDHTRDGSLAEELVALVEGDSLRAERIEAGHRRAGVFSWDRCARETVEVYSRVVSR